MDPFLLNQLAIEHGYQFRVENGQLIYGPPYDKIDFVPPKNSEVFIGKLPKDIDGRLVVNKFRECGRIITFRIMQNFSGLNRGFAFVQYETVQQAENAIRLFNNYEIRPGDRIGVIRSRNNCRLYIGRLNSKLSKDQIFLYFQSCTSGLINVTYHKDTIQDTGYAFLEYETHKDAAKARRKLKPTQLELGGNYFSCEWATTNGPEHPYSHNGRSSSSNSFTDNFSNIVVNHLAGNWNLEEDDVFAQRPINHPRTSGEVILICTNIRADADPVQLNKVFTMNSQIDVKNIQRTHDCMVIHYPSYETAFSILKIFEDIKQEFSRCFGDPNNTSELIWLTDNSQVSAYLNLNQNSMRASSNFSSF